MKARSSPASFTLMFLREVTLSQVMDDQALFFLLRIKTKLCTAEAWGAKSTATKRDWANL